MKISCKTFSVDFILQSTVNVKSQEAYLYRSVRFKGPNSVEFVRDEIAVVQSQ
jgi:hypothetical protein